MKKIKMYNTNKNIILSEAFENFIVFKKAVNLSNESIIYYNNCFNYFTEFFSKDLCCNLISHSTILEYISYLQKIKPNISSTTINSYLRGLRAILYYFMELEYLDSFKIHLIKADKKIKETYTENELKILLKKPDIKTCAFTEYRNWVIINYFLATGNRISTVINIRIKEIDMNNNSIILSKTKSRKQQIIPISNKLTIILKEYLQYRKGTPDSFLFCNHEGEYLTKNSLQNSLQDYNRKRGVTKTSAHLFRHTFAKMWILNGGDIFRLQKILGHSSIDIVKEYVSMFAEDLQKDYDKFNPLDNLDINNSGNKIKMIK